MDHRVFLRDAPPGEPWTPGRRRFERKLKEQGSRWIEWSDLSDESKASSERAALEDLIDRSTEKLEALVRDVLHTGESEHVRVVLAEKALTELVWRAKSGGHANG